MAGNWGASSVLGYDANNQQLSQSQSYALVPSNTYQSRGLESAVSNAIPEPSSALLVGALAVGGLMRRFSRAGRREERKYSSK